jgi:hypothetical protein
VIFNILKELSKDVFCHFLSTLVACDKKFTPLSYPKEVPSGSN